MTRKVFLILLALVLAISAGLVACGGLGEEEEEEEEQQEYYLASDFDVAGTVDTTAGEEMQTTVSGTIEFRVVPDSGGKLTMSLTALDLVAGSVPAVPGTVAPGADSGLIGLTLVGDEYETTYDPDTGEITTEFRSILHYELIDQIEGYQEIEEEEEQDVFVPYTEQMTGTLTGQLPENLQIGQEGETVDFNADLALDIDPDLAVLGDVRSIRSIIIIHTFPWWKYKPCKVLPIQPVFIGTGPTDPNRTGTAFDTLMGNATELWDRCGTVGCLKFQVNDPIYLNETGYKVLDSEGEAVLLSHEVSDPDAVEIFVVQSMTFACKWGGGACYSSGTASARIVTCDQQLSVPCPCPCTGFCPCGDCGVDPSTCGAVNPYHLAHELGHALNLDHPDGAYAAYGLNPSTATSVMEPSGFCCDNPDVQSAMNCRNAESPLLRSTLCMGCGGSPDIPD